MRVRTSSRSARRCTRWQRGKRAFEGRSQAAMLSAILTSAAAADSAVAADASRRRSSGSSGVCLAKDPDARWQTAHDVGLPAADAPRERHGFLRRSDAAIPPRRRARWLHGGSRPPRWRWPRSPWLRPRTPAPPPVRSVSFPLPPPTNRAFYSTFETTEHAVSPDGSRIAFVSSAFAVSAARRGIAAADAPGSRADLGSRALFARVPAGPGHRRTPPRSSGPRMAHRSVSSRRES